jgi:hypothetical protein
LLPSAVASAPEAAARQLLAYAAVQTQVEIADGDARVAIGAAEALGTKTAHLARLVGDAGAAVGARVIAQLQLTVATMAARAAQAFVLAIRFVQTPTALLARVQAVHKTRGSWNFVFHLNSSFVSLDWKDLDTEKQFSKFNSNAQNTVYWLVSLLAQSKFVEKSCVSYVRHMRKMWD